MRVEVLCKEVVSCEEVEVSYEGGSIVQDQVRRRTHHVRWTNRVRRWISCDEWRYDVRRWRKNRYGWMDTPVVLWFGYGGSPLWLVTRPIVTEDLQLSLTREEGHVRGMGVVKNRTVGVVNGTQWKCVPLLWSHLLPTSSQDSPMWLPSVPLCQTKPSDPASLCSAFHYHCSDDIIHCSL